MSHNQTNFKLESRVGVICDVFFLDGNWTLGRI